MSGIAMGLVVAIAALLAAALARVLLPTLRRIALAHPNARSSHRIPTPQGGGIAVITATLLVACGAAVAGYVDPTTGWFAFGLVVLATAFLAVVGAIDDIRTIDVAPRLLLQALAAALVVASLPSEWRVLDILPWWIERVLLAVALLWFVNLTNFMDGLDWMTVAETVPVAAGIAIVGLLSGLPIEAVVMALALGGAMIGFAPFNRPVARLFLGDVGSLPVGLLLGWMLALLASSGHLAAALLLPLYYLADATVTLLRRAFNGEAVWQAHRRHFYQQAVDAGMSVHAIVGRVFVVNVALGLLACATVLAPSASVAWSCLVIGAVLVAALLRSFARARDTSLA